MSDRTDRIAHATAERRFRALLERHELPQPDEVAHWRDAVVLGWHDSKAIIVIDLDEVDETLPEAGAGPLADYLAAC